MIGNLKGVRNILKAPSKSQAKSPNKGKACGKGATVSHMHHVIHHVLPIYQPMFLHQMFPPPLPMHVQPLPGWDAHCGQGHGWPCGKGWSKDHPACTGGLHEEVHDDHDDKAWGDSKRRFNEPNNKIGGGCKKSRIEKGKYDRGGEDNKC